MRTMSLMATLAVAILIAGPANAQSIRHGNGVYGPDNQVTYGGMVVGQDPDPNVRLEILRGAGRPGGN